MVDREWALHALADLRGHQGNFKAMAKLYDQAIELRSSHLESDDPLMLATRANRVVLLTGHEQQREMSCLRSAILKRSVCCSTADLPLLNSAACAVAGSFLNRNRDRVSARLLLESMLNRGDRDSMPPGSKNQLLDAYIQVLRQSGDKEQTALYERIKASRGGTTPFTLPKCPSDLGR